MANYSWKMRYFMLLMIAILTSSFFRWHHLSLFSKILNPIEIILFVIFFVRNERFRKIVSAPNYPTCPRCNSHWYKDNDEMYFCRNNNCETSLIHPKYNNIMNVAFVWSAGGRLQLHPQRQPQCVNMQQILAIIGKHKVTWSHYHNKCFIEKYKTLKQQREEANEIIKRLKASAVNGHVNAVVSEPLKPYPWLPFNITEEKIDALILLA